MELRIEKLGEIKIEGEELIEREIVILVILEIIRKEELKIEKKLREFVKELEDLIEEEILIDEEERENMEIENEI